MTATRLNRAMRENQVVKDLPAERLPGAHGERHAGSLKRPD